MPDTVPEDINVMDLSRNEVIHRLLHFPGTFDMDFTPEYLHSLSDEQLHHVLLAAYLYAHRGAKH